MSVFRGPVTPVSQRARKLGALRGATPQLRSIFIEGITQPLTRID